METRHESGGPGGQPGPDQGPRKPVGPGQYGGDFGPDGEEPCWRDGYGGAAGQTRAVGYGGFAGRGPRRDTPPGEPAVEQVCDRLRDHPEIDASAVEVGLRGGEVVLRGSVPDEATKQLTQDVAAAVAGVRGVRNELRVAAAATG